MNIRLKFLYMVLAGGMISSLCVASPETGNENVPSEVKSDPQQENQKEDQQEDQKKEEGISTERKIAGYAVLAFLLVWMFVRSGKNKLEKEDSAEEIVEEEGKETFGDSSDSPKN